MLRFLFPRLTAGAARGSGLFRWAVGEARAAHWYAAGKVADSLDGRFAMLATVTALVMVRLERDGEPGDAASVALTERFVEAMAAEHRELGIGDPTLGRTVRKLVGSLARRVELWRAAVARESWAEAARTSAYRGETVADGALSHTESALRALWDRLEAAPIADLAEGRVE